MRAADTRHRRGDALLLEHCAALELALARRSAVERLEDELGAELVRMLLSALSTRCDPPRQRFATSA